MSIRDFKPYKSFTIRKDNNILGDNVYLGNGQGCGTIWFKDVSDARIFIDYWDRKHFDFQDFPYANLHIPSIICEHCQCHYSITDSNYKKYPDYACHNWKEYLKQLAGVYVSYATPNRWQINDYENAL